MIDHDPGAPAPGEVRVAIKAAGVSYVDVLTAMGEYQFKPPLPYIPGSEYAGIVEAVGEGVADLNVGTRVFGSGMGGIFAETGLFKAANVTRVPEPMSFAEAAVLSVSYLTAYYALVDRGRAKAGETLLVLGAAGGTGYAAVQVGKYLGLTVIASASSPAKRALALAGGADQVIETGASDWRQQVSLATGGKKVDIVFDPVGGSATESAFRTLGYDGRHLVVGFPAGIASLPTNLALLKSASLIGVQLRGLALERPDEALASRQEMLRLAEQGIFRPAIAQSYPLEQYAAAMQAALAGTAAGRIVLTMD